MKQIDEALTGVYREILEKLPDGYEILCDVEDITKDKDLILSCFLGYCEWDEVIDVNNSDAKHYLGQNLKGISISNFKGVARRVTIKNN